MSVRRLTAVAAVLVLALAACGDSDDDTATTASASPSASATTGVAGVVAAADAFLGTLSTAQKKIAQEEFTQAKAVAWSNLPCGTECRPGIEFGTLSDAQLTAAKLVLQRAMGTGSGSGWDQAQKIMLADGVLSTAQGSSQAGMPSGGTPPSGGSMPSGGMPTGGTTASSTATSNGQTTSGYGTGVYFLGFLGTPSTTGTWELSFGGHHLAVHLTYKAGKVVGTTPFFIGVEPKTWTASGTTYAPLATMHDGMAAMLQGLTTAELATAELSETYSDVLLGPSEDGQFPATKVGLPVSGLTAAQKKLVLTAITPWVKVAADADATTLLSEYEANLDKTYVAWSGGSALTKHADYVRVDGPGVWVEFVCQNGVVYQNQIHYHTVYRDHTRDYGGEFTF